MTARTAMREVSEAELLKRMGERDARALVAVFGTKESAPAAALMESMRAAEGDFKDRLEVVMVDMDRARGACAELRVHRVPELLVFADGRILERTEGAMSPAQVKDLLEHALGRLARFRGTGA